MQLTSWSSESNFIFFLVRHIPKHNVLIKNGDMNIHISKDGKNEFLLTQLTKFFLEKRHKAIFSSQNEGVHTESRGRVKERNGKNLKFVIFTKNMAVEISHWLILAGISPYKRSRFFEVFLSFFIQTRSTKLTRWRPGIPDPSVGVATWANLMYKKPKLSMRVVHHWRTILYALVGCIPIAAVAVHLNLKS